MAYPPPAYQPPPPQPYGPPPPAGAPPPYGAPPPMHPVAPVEQPLPVWGWILPILLTWLGGLICWFMWKDKNRRTAKNMLILGIVFTFLPVIIFAVMGAACCASAYY